MKASILKWTFVLFISVMILSVLFPLFCMFIISIKDKSSYIQNGFGIIDVDWTFDNYIKMFTEYHVHQKMLNSLLVSFTVSLCVCLIAVFAAYCMMYINSVLRRIIVVTMIIMIFMPSQVTISAKYQLFLKLELIDTYFSVILSGIADWLPTSIFLLYIYLQSINKDLIFASKVDGCNEFQVIIFVVIPISLPAISVIFINSFTGMWNELLTPMLFLHSEEKRMLIPSLAGLVQRYRSNLPFQMAGYVCGILPTLFIYTIFKNKILNGFNLQHTDN